MPGPRRLPERRGVEARASGRPSRRSAHGTTRCPRTSPRRRVVRLDGARGAARAGPRPTSRMVVVGVVALPLRDRDRGGARARGFHADGGRWSASAVVGWRRRRPARSPTCRRRPGWARSSAAGALGLLFVAAAGEARGTSRSSALLVIGVDIVLRLRRADEAAARVGRLGVVSTVHACRSPAPGMYAAAGHRHHRLPVPRPVLRRRPATGGLRPRLTLPLCALSFSASPCCSPSCWIAPCRAAAAVAGVPAAQHRAAAAERADRPWELRRVPATTRQRASATPPRRPDRARPLGARAATPAGSCSTPLIAPGASVGGRRRRQLRRPAADPHRRARRARRPARPRPGACRARSRTSRAACAAKHAGAGGRRQRRPRRPHLARAVRGRPRARQLPTADWGPFGDGPYDVVVGDLFYSQLLTPGCATLASADERIMLALTNYGPALTGLVVSRMHASAPDGVVVHIHDPVGWWTAARAAVHARPRAGGRPAARPTTRWRCCRPRSRPGAGRTRGRPWPALGIRSCARRSGAGRSGAAPTTWRARPSPPLPAGLRPRR